MQLRFFEFETGDHIETFHVRGGAPQEEERLNLHDPKTGTDRVATVRAISELASEGNRKSRDVFVLWDANGEFPG
jgi:hypothetical protein